MSGQEPAHLHGTGGQVAQPLLTEKLSSPLPKHFWLHRFRVAVGRFRNHEFQVQGETAGEVLTETVSW